MIADARPWTVSRFYRREYNPIYQEYPCTAYARSSSRRRSYSATSATTTAGLPCLVRRLPSRATREVAAYGILNDFKKQSIARCIIPTVAVTEEL